MNIEGRKDDGDSVDGVDDDLLLFWVQNNPPVYNLSKKYFIA